MYAGHGTRTEAAAALAHPARLVGRIRIPAAKKRVSHLQRDVTLIARAATTDCAASRTVNQRMDQAHLLPTCGVQPRLSAEVAAGAFGPP